MSNVTLTIGGRSFTVACADGEEGHVGELGETINAKIASMGDLSAQSESRMLLFATLLLADEVHELRGLRQSQAPGDDLPAGIASLLENMARRLENVAERLEG